MKRWFLIINIVGTLLLWTSHTQKNDAPAMGSDAIIQLTNIEREKQGVAPLIYNEELSEAAERKAEDMVKEDYFAHVSPAGKEPWDFIRESGYEFESAGENLAVGYDTPQEAVEAWMNSPGHRKNILAEKFQEIGVGVRVQRNKYLIVQEFGRPGLWDGPIVIR